MRASELEQRVRPTTLADWLDYQQRVHARSIDLGLERVREVWQRMGSPQSPLTITVGGTNGKGSTVAFLDAMLTSLGLRVGRYTSPHLLVYNERVRVAGVDATDAQLCDAFARIEDARGETSLTYFEFGTLAALDLFAAAHVDVAVLEVGLGGRLDATNIIDADAAIVTTIGLDHMEWLGTDRDAIGVEKAGIARARRPLIIGEDDPPAGLLDALARTGASVQRAGIDFQVDRLAHGWRWRHVDGCLLDLPDPSLDGPRQHANAAAAIAAVHALREVFAARFGAGAAVSGGDLPALASAIAEGLRRMDLPGRLQCLQHAPDLIVDVAHNPQAAAVLAQWLDAHPIAGRTHAVFGALGDKDVAGVIAALGTRIDVWHLAGLDQASPRGLPAAELATIFAPAQPDAQSDVHVDVATALDVARAVCTRTDRIIAFGSFFVARAVLVNA